MRNPICTNAWELVQITMAGRKRTTGTRNPFPEPLNSDFTDFCEAHRGAPGNRIVQDALRTFIDERLAAEPELRKRFEAARRKRLGLIEGGNVTVLPTSK
jgi:hypothetical protein